MTKILVLWGRRVAIGDGKPDEVRTLMQEFGSARKAAELAADLIYMLDGSDASNAWSDKNYLVSRKKPRVQYDNQTRDQWVRVEYQDT